jgi:uncharacterized protein (TIGR02172 family)
MSKGALIGKGRTADIYAWGDDSVLKLFHAGRSSGEAAYEAKIASAVHASGAASPALLDTVEFEGRQGLIYERIHGPSLAEVLRHSPWQLPRLARAFARLQASMHRRTASDLPSQRQCLSRKIEAASPLPSELKERALQALSHLPDGNVLCHGDFHPENIIMSPRGPVTIDWVDATRGNPLADVARTSLILSAAHLYLPANPGSLAVRFIIAAFHRIYLAHYVRATNTQERQIRVWRGPVAAARLEEAISIEEAWLVKTVASSLRLWSN